MVLVKAFNEDYRQTSSVSRTKFKNLNVSHLAMQFLLHNPLKPGGESGMNMQLGQHRQAMLQLHLSNQTLYCLLRCGLY